MSTALKRSLADANADAQAFAALFPGCFQRWAIAGSVRRRKPEVGDIEHVVMPAFGERDVMGGLFTERATVNLLWHRLDELLAAGEIAKHVYQVNRADGTQTTRNMWGDNYRGIDWRGHMHEIFAATPQNWGAVLLIRTGPADYSERVVTTLKQGGMFRQQEGKLVRVATGETVEVPDEETYVRLAGMAYLKPEDRR